MFGESGDVKLPIRKSMARCIQAVNISSSSLTFGKRKHLRGVKLRLKGDEDSEEGKQGWNPEKIAVLNLFLRLPIQNCISTLPSYM